jgi:hypothetical protein
MKYNIFVICVLFSILCFASCQKEPAKGDYRGTFTGDFAVDSMYTTVYYFEITRSTKKELWIKEKQSQTTSKLTKHSNDSISGMIGFAGEIYDPDNKERAIFSLILIAGNYNSNNIKGTFSTTLSKGEQQYNSTGTFILEPF